MFISPDASPVGRRDHMVRLWQALNDLGLYAEDGWQSAIHPLRIAASIEKVEASTDFVELEIVAFCNPAADYEKIHSAFMSQYIAEITAMLWTWIAYENLKGILLSKNRNNPDQPVIEFMRKKMESNSLSGLRKIESKAFEISQSSIFESKFPKLQKKIREYWKPGNSENMYLDLRICRLTRNEIIHGNIPNPSGWDEKTNYEPEEDEIIVF